MATSTRIGLHTAFGWRVAHMAMPAGAEHTLLIRKYMQRHEMPAQALWTKGRVESFNQSGEFLIGERIKGSFTGEFGPVRKGRLVLRATSDSEWWCVPASLNGGLMPVLSALRVPAGQTLPLAAGTKFLLCDGDLSVGASAVAVGESMESAEAVASSVSGALGLIFSDAAP